MNSTDDLLNRARDDTAAPRGEPHPLPETIMVIYRHQASELHDKLIPATEALRYMELGYDIGYHEGKKQGQIETLAATQKELMNLLRPNATPPPQVHIDKSDNVSINE